MSTAAVSSQPASQSYWNIDGDFMLASQQPYDAHNNSVLVHNAPWGNSSWSTFGFSIYNNRTPAPIDEYMISVTGGIGHAWVREDRRVVGARTGVTGFGEDQSYGYPPPLIPMFGRDTILAYRIMRENTNISTVWPSPDSDGILFDLFAQSQYRVNGSAYNSYLVIDFYVHQECGPLNGLCAYTNDTTLANGLSNNHIIVGHTHFFEWRIHSNLDENVWASDIVNLRWYLQESQRMAYCHDTTGSDNCSATIPQAYLFGLTATAETFGGTSGFAVDYEYLLQANDCGIGLDAGNDFNHPLRINDLSQAHFREVDGWLGVGSLYKDSDDYYQFSVSKSIIVSGGSLYGGFEGADSIALYSAGNPLSLKIIFSVPHLEFTYGFNRTDPEGDWYLRVHRSAGFGFYSFDVGIDVPSPSVGSLPATCSLGSALPSAETSWQLIAGLTVITTLIVVGGRRWSGKPPPKA